MTPEIQGYSRLQEPNLLFGNNNENIHPLKGLSLDGPYKGISSTHINCALLSFRNERDKIIGLVNELKKPSSIITYFKEYYTPYLGFKKIFGADLVFDQNATYTFPDRIKDIFAKKAPKSNFKSEINNLFAIISRDKASFGVLLVALPDSDESFYADLKMVAAKYRIAIQIIKEKSYSEKNRVNVLWGLSIAIFAKAGGIPWLLKSIDSQEAYLGISYSLKTLPDSEKPSYITCCSQIFEPDGTGFEFLAYRTGEFTLDRQNNPYLSYHEMGSLMSRSLNIYQNRHPGAKLPKKIYIHKNTEFKEEEINACVDAFKNIKIELVQIIRKNLWRGIRVNGKDIISDKECYRGSFLPISSDTCLLWVQGAVDLGSSNVFFKESYATPKPLIIKRFYGDSSWNDVCSGILGLTKMDWNNNLLYKSMPATLVYSQKFAQIIQDQPIEFGTEYNFIYFM